MSNLYLSAIRTKLRFASAKGLLSVEDLFDLPLTSEKGTSLNGIAQSVNRELRASGEESFVSSAKKTPSDVQNQLRLDILKDVIATKERENELNANARNIAAREQEIMGLIARRQAAERENLSMEELQAELAALRKQA